MVVVPPSSIASWPASMAIDPLFPWGSFQDVKEAINNLESWSRAKKVPTPLALQPASCYVQAQPKGVT